MPRLSGWCRLALVLAFSIGMVIVHADQAAACSCGWSGYEEAIKAAEVAFIGRVVAKDEAPLFGGGDLMETTLHTFDVTRSKTPMQSPFALKVVIGSGAGCGLDMSVGEEWVVIATSWDDGLQTNLCNGTVLAGSLDDAELARIEDALPHDDPAPAEPIESEFAIPMPIIVVGAATLVIALFSLAAFRRRSAS